NGEIYNHPALKKELEQKGLTYKTRSDAETILKLYQLEGKNCLARLKGMFAFAVWDARKKEILLARDPCAIKPLYYFFDGASLIFASELRAILKSGIATELDTDAVFDYLQYGFVHAPFTIIKGVRKIPAGHYLSFKAGEEPSLIRYHKFNISEVKIDKKSAVAELDSLFNESVKSHLLSDVAVGSFLSGGLDSSLVTAVMQKHVGERVKTFSIGFSGLKKGIDESAYARRAAQFLKTQHHELILPADALKKIPELIFTLDEPLGDSAVIPTYYLAKHAREHVKVALSGEGADEIFAGYPRYKTAMLSERAKNLPSVMVGALRMAAKISGWQSTQNLPFNSPADWGRAIRHSSPEKIIPYIKPPRKNFSPLLWERYIETASGFNSMLFFDFQTIMADCLLMKVDKASMAAGLETRVPFLDENLVRFALGLPAEMKMKFFSGKWILKKLAEKYLPMEIIHRRKHGFWSPWEEWLFADAAKISEELKKGKFAQADIFNTDKIIHDIAARRDGAPLDAGLLYRIAILAFWLNSL
ncbi:MAG: asparagine synthase (glutamine-hydrolyzing), partial [Elusimicrobia bacterium]|nr:asparagine synthase (glutamine-hydrolyzing) [Elusimicrobiota bacterium]